jgi:hypothetical protein
MLNQIVLQAIEQLAAHQGLTADQAAVRCVLTGRIPTFPNYSRCVVAAYTKLETEQTRWGADWQTEDALSGRR